MDTRKSYIMTYEGVKKTEEELNYLKTIKRREITNKIKSALQYGDLSENSEYEEAKNEQAFLEGKISQLENILKNVIIIDENEIDDKTVNVGSIVKVKDEESNEIQELTIVGSTEADPANYKISNEAPIGKGLIGKKVGDVVEIPVPDGIIKYKILEIKRT